jgi:hypothetical protein
MLSEICNIYYDFDEINEGINLGVFIDQTIYKNFSVQSEFIYYQKINNSEDKVTNNNNYLSIPVVAKIPFDKQHMAYLITKKYISM